MTSAALARPVSSAVSPEQLLASDPAASVWVNASAGSGKTTVLTSRVMRLLLSGVRPEKILCLTYTRAGAAEMANRVTSKLSKWAVCSDQELDEELDRLQNAPPQAGQRTEARRLFARVLSCPGGLRIRTIHSFCQEILSRFPIEAGLPPHFALIDPVELDVLRREVVADLLREAGENPQQGLAPVIASLVAGQGESGFDQMLKAVTGASARMADAIEQAGGAEALAAEVRNLLQLEPEDTPQSIRAGAMARLPEAELRQLATWLQDGKPSFAARGKSLASIMAVLPKERAAFFDKYCGVFLTKEGEAFSKPAGVDQVKKYPQITEITSREVLLLQLALERIEAAEIAQLTSSVLTFGHAFTHRLAQRKAARAALDYDDLIHFTDALLQRSGIAPWILYKLDNGIDHVLVDEAQDTSRAQWNIVQALTQEFHAGAGAQEDKNRTLFVVGDEKQSIFSFQNADPEAFLSLREFFAQRLAGAGKKMERIGLHTSYRSAPAVLGAVDKVFASEAASRGVSSEPIRHRAHNAGPHNAGRVEIWPLLAPTDKDESGGGDWVMPTMREDESNPQAELADLIAAKIKGWLTNRETLPGFSRPIAPGDIMILLRARGRFADLMVRALKSAGVPVTGVDRMRLMEQLPVMDLLALVRFVLLPEDDLNLAALLRGPLFGVSEEQLMDLAVGRAGSLWQGLKDKAEALSFAATARDYLAARLREADFSTPFAFLSQVLNAACPASAVSGRQALWTRLGDEALDPIEELLNAAQTYGRSRTPSLQNFLHWLIQSNAEIKRELDEGSKMGEGQVRIMTVHASKGLEAPIVFLPDTASLPRSVDVPKLQWSADGAPMFLARQPKAGAARQLWLAARERQLEEYRRLFYVALTRAARRLYICGWQNSKKGAGGDDSWYGLALAALRDAPAAPGGGDGQKPAFAVADAVAPVAVTVTVASPVAPSEPLPSWAALPVAAAALAVSDAPEEDEAADTAAATPDAAFARGRIIHRLLQSLPEITTDKRAEATARFLAHPRHGLTAAQREEIAEEVGRLLADDRFSALFAADSLVEAPLTGSLGGITLFRQVDRLCLRGDEVWIVDYKTNRPPPVRVEDIPASYRRQLDEYRALLSGIYPDKKVRCFLLWTYAPRLMEVI